MKREIMSSSPKETVGLSYVKSLDKNIEKIYERKSGGDK